MALGSGGERHAQQHLGLRRAVNVGGVEEVDASVQRRVHDASGGVLIDARTKVVTPQSDRRNPLGAE